jgi:hypothetical protein
MGRQYGSTAQSPLLATAAAQSSILPYLQSQLMTSPVLIRRTIVNRLFDEAWPPSKPKAPAAAARRALVLEQWLHARQARR